MALSKYVYNPTMFFAATMTSSFTVTGILNPTKKYEYTVDRPLFSKPLGAAMRRIYTVSMSQDYSSLSTTLLEVVIEAQNSDTSSNCSSNREA